MNSPGEKQPLAEQLRALAAGERHRSEAARLRDVFDEIEAALRAGVSRQAILDALHEHGFTMNLRSFDTAMYRIRQKRRLAPAQVKPQQADPDDRQAAEQSLGDVLDKAKQEAKTARYIGDGHNPLIKRKRKDQKEQE